MVDKLISDAVFSKIKANYRWHSALKPWEFWVITIVHGLNIGCVFSIPGYPVHARIEFSLLWIRVDSIALLMFFAY